MTVNEASEKYHIPVEVLKEYESWGLCGEVKKVMGVWQYNDQDLQRLSMIMTLHDVGFINEEVEAYMRLFLKGDSTEKERLETLKKKRGKVLDEIHFKEKQIDCMDDYVCQQQSSQDCHGRMGLGQWRDLRQPSCC